MALKSATTAFSPTVYPTAAEYFDQGNALQKCKQFEAALLCYEQACSLQPDFAQAWWKHGNILQNLNCYPAAMASYDRAIALKPDYAEAYSNKGIVLQKLRQYAAALDSFQQAIALKPDYANAYNNCGLAFKDLRQFEAELEYYEKAIAIKPDFAEAYNNHGNALQNLKRYEQAVVSYEQAINLRPDHAKAYNNHAGALLKLKRYADAAASYQRALALDPDYEFLLGNYLHTKLKICDWRNIEPEIAVLIEKLQSGAKVTYPFNVLAITDDPALQLRAAQIWATQKTAVNLDVLPNIPKPPRRGRIRIAYFSADFCMHPVALLTAELYEIHDRSKFEIIGISAGADKDEMTDRLQAGFDRFIDVQGFSPGEVVELARSLEIDIAVDLGGYTGANETKVFAMRVAPVQVSYLGYSATLGVDYMDYLIADPVLIPAACREHYSEKIVYLPHSYQVNDSRRAISDRQFSRVEFGLPDSGFVFCSFNNGYKLNPNIFSCWMRILSQVEGSVLWLAVDAADITDNLLKEAAVRGIGPDRMIFTGRMPRLDEHLARLRLADLFLDTLPYNAHTTASDALWAGLPVLTCPGQTYAARVAASLLTTIGLPELIAETPAQYEALAIELAANPEKLAGIKAKLAQNRLTTPLFDTGLFTRHLEAAYTQMYDRYQAGLPPEHIDA
jgi:predicted O-linked N-acetylglucosamine transferase (SPINDLY family)